MDNNKKNTTQEDIKIEKFTATLGAIPKSQLLQVDVNLQGAKNTKLEKSRYKDNPNYFEK